MSSGALQPSSSTQTASSLLLCEALGFSPQLLLDDIINIANNAVQDGVNGMEEFLQKWAEERDARGGNSHADTEATTHEVEQGLVAFQTLLEYHTDIAFDFFEAWSLRNIFMVPPDLPVVLPHQEGLDLTATPEKEQELMDEVEELRKRLDSQRKLNRGLHRAIRTSSRQLTKAQARASRLGSLRSTIDQQQALPPKFIEMYKTLSSLPELEPPPPSNVTEPGKRQWETSKTGYMNWALNRLLVKGKVVEGDGQAPIEKLDAAAAEIGSGDDLRKALSSVEKVQRQLDAVEGRNSNGSEEEEGDSRMEE